MALKQNNKAAQQQASAAPIQVIGKASAEQIAQWKAKYGSVYEIEADGHYGYLKKPDRKTLSYAMAAKANPIQSDEALMKGCWIDGSNALIDDNDLFMSARLHLPMLIEVKAASIKKL